MELEFLRGDSRKPRGHAIVYFDLSGGAPGIAATYLIVPPITISLSKYLPPMMANRVDLRETPEVSAVPLPPVPERVESVAWLERVAEVRGDDFIRGGTVTEDALLQASAEAAQRYLSLYQSTTELDIGKDEAPPPELSVDDMIFGLLPDSARIGEIAKLTGKLRYAVETTDSQLVEETIAEMQQVGRHLPESYRIASFLAVARQPGERGQRLAELYLDRCYKLANEDYAGLSDIEQRIRSIELSS